VLLEKKYRVKASLARLHAGVNNYASHEAVLLIGDEALRRNKSGLQGFDLVYDLAREWYDWKKLPFVFAVWAMKKSLDEETKRELKEILTLSLDACEGDFIPAAGLHGRAIGLTDQETQEYLTGFNYRLGERERESMIRFRELISAIEPVTIES
jgi:chorismate dehydratase